MGSLRHTLLLVLSHLALLALAREPAQAHPHIFVDVDLQIEVASDGVAKRLRYEWAFDEMYSAFAIQGLPRSNGKPSAEALRKLAEEMIDKLDDVDYFTRATAEDHELQAIAEHGAQATFEDGRIRLSFSLLLRSIKGEARRVDVRVFDPTYVVAVTLKDGVKLHGPAHCRYAIRRPGPLDPNDARQLDDSIRTNQLADNFGAKLATTVALACGE
jgi:ABC-type uncharacterized transport system substrate-binding protein